MDYVDASPDDLRLGNIELLCAFCQRFYCPFVQTHLKDGLFRVIRRTAHLFLTQTVPLLS